VDDKFGLEFDLAAMALQFAFHNYNEMAAFRWGAVSVIYCLNILKNIQNSNLVINKA
jgi:hypothetical protein